MEEIVKVDFDSQTVSARDLYESVGSTERFSSWFERQLQFGFIENEDYSNPLKVLRVQMEGYREVQREVEDYNLSIDMAKQICMIQKNERAREIRQYLINLEKAWNTPEQVFARALKMADKVISDKERLIAEMKPKADFFDAVADSKTAIAIGEVAKALGIKGLGRNNLFEILRNKGVLMGNNIPYQKYVDAGYFRVIEQKYTKPNGDTEISLKTLVYQKGVEYIRKRVMTEEQQ